MFFASVDVDDEEEDKPNRRKRGRAIYRSTCFLFQQRVV